MNNTNMFDTTISVEEITACEDFSKAFKMAAARLNKTMKALCLEHGYDYISVWLLTKGKKNLTVNNVHWFEDMTGIPASFWFILWGKNYM